MNPIDFQAIREALMRRSNTPSMNQGAMMPILSQIGSSVSTSPIGTRTSPTTPPPTVSRPPTPQPRFSSPFAGPRKDLGEGFDLETKRLAKLLISRLLQVF